MSTTTNTRKRGRPQPTTPQQGAEEQYLKALDLDSLVARFAREHPNKASLRSAVLEEYRRFLILKVVHHDGHARILSPSPLVDAMWHLHVLDTASYANMCENIAFFIHHNPDGGLDAVLRKYRYETTLASYKERWGVPGEIIWPKTLLNLSISPKTPKPATANPGKHVMLASWKGLTRLNFDPERPGVLVEDLERAISTEDGIPFENNRRLLWCGDRLERRRSLKGYGIQSGDTIETIFEQVG